MKTDFFQSCGHCLVFQICWHIECSTFTASSFRIWNSSTGIPSPPLALFIVMLSKAHLLHMPGCLALGQWPHHRDYLGREDLFCTVLPCILPPLLNIFCFCWSIPFLSFIEPIFAWNISLVSLIFLKRSPVFPILLFSSISLHWLLKAFLSLVAILWNSAFKSRQESWSGIPAHIPRDLPNSGIKPTSPALAGRFSTTSTIWEPPMEGWGRLKVKDDYVF